MIRHIFRYAVDDNAGGGEADPDATPEETAKAPVPYERFATVYAKGKEAGRAAAAAAADAKAARDEAAAAKTAQAGWDTERTKLTGDLAARDARLTLARAGVIDDDHAEALQSVYDRLPAEGKPATPAELWAAIKDGKTQAPRMLAGFLPSVATRVAEPPPRLPGAGGSQEPAGSGVKIEQVTAARVAWEGRPHDAALKKAAIDLMDRYRAQEAARR